MNYKQLQTLFWDVTNDILGKGLKQPDKFIRFKYPQDGMPDWKITDDIIFVNLDELNDDYAKQIDSIFKSEGGSIKKYMARTRVWRVLYSIYGPNSYELANKLKDSFFTQKVHDKLSSRAVFLIPNLPTCVQVNELFAGRWWDRWDLNLNFNELYQMPVDDVGSIDNLHITTNINRR